MVADSCCSAAVQCRGVLLTPNPLAQSSHGRRHIPQCKVSGEFQVLTTSWDDRQASPPTDRNRRWLGTRTYRTCTHSSHPLWPHLGAGTQPDNLRSVSTWSKNPLLKAYDDLKGTRCSPGPPGWHEHERAHGNAFFRSVRRSLGAWPCPGTRHRDNDNNLLQPDRKEDWAGHHLTYLITSVAFSLIVGHSCCRTRHPSQFPHRDSGAVSFSRSPSPPRAQSRSRRSATPARGSMLMWSVTGDRSLD
jgi:hypothetical protein